MMGRFFSSSRDKDVCVFLFFVLFFECNWDKKISLRACNFVMCLSNMREVKCFNFLRIPISFTQVK